ncbi:MAG: hypothetical protein K2X27_10075 [Candidatus Obscuribacterales bacterium]|nr:hypothetical protein [Candidatus Obscuribacterales bacterium]
MAESAKQNKQLLFLGLLLSLGAVITVANAGLGAKPAAPKQYVFSRSSKQTSSSSLGISGVPAYVNFPDGSQKRGVYITQASPGGRWQSLGLRPGRILFSIDNRVVESPTVADSILSASSGVLEYSYATVTGGVPTLVRTKGDFSSSAGYAGESVYARGMARRKSDPEFSGVDTETAAAKKAIESTPISQLESHMVSLINKDRAANGKSSLSENSRLAELARHYAEYLIANGKFSHTADGRDPMQRARAAGIGGGIAENLAFRARGTAPEKDLVAKAEAIFMAEPPNMNNHRGNILWDVGQSVGVGIARNDSTLMMVQEFSDGNP